ncbi:MAG: hypothetical protein NT070_22890, partial [Cyanobacteria bacterium]|nr:hypothetical protein [Cyanobacteriota bacterium]
FLDFLQEGIEKIKDPRSKSNATKLKISDAMLSVFSMFFMQNHRNGKVVLELLLMYRGNIYEHKRRPSKPSTLPCTYKSGEM